ncbi:MAG: hypothetical protein QJR02_07200 [Sinobacteraceae bacterium]|nr:hypothetical protein [Nevskiaceae bacterium]
MPAVLSKAGPMPQIAKTPLAAITNATGTNDVTLISGGVGAWKMLEALHVTSTCAASRKINIKATDNTTTVVLGQITVPALAGTDGVTPALNLITQGIIAAWLNRMPLLGNSITIKANATVAPGSGEQIGFMAEYWDYDSTVTP